MSEWIRTGQAVKAFHLLGWNFITTEQVRKMADAGEFEALQAGEGLNYRIRSASLAAFLRHKAPACPRLPEALALLAGEKISA